MPRWETALVIRVLMLQRETVLFIMMVNFQGNYATVGDGFAPLRPPLPPWENRIGRGQDRYNISMDIATTRPNRPSGRIL